MDELEIERHILRAIHELELIQSEYEYKKDIDNQDRMSNIVELLLEWYPNVKEELQKETWK